MHVRKKNVTVLGDLKRTQKTSALNLHCSLFTLTFIQEPISPHPSQPMQTSKVRLGSEPERQGVIVLANVADKLLREIGPGVYMAEIAHDGGPH